MPAGIDKLLELSVMQLTAFRLEIYVRTRVSRV